MAERDPQALDMIKYVLLIGEQQSYQPTEDEHNVGANVWKLWTGILPTK